VNMKDLAKQLEDLMVESALNGLKDHTSLTDFGETINSETGESHYHSRLSVNIKVDSYVPKTKCDFSTHPSDVMREADDEALRDMVRKLLGIEL
jgi:hypothetical protein